MITTSSGSAGQAADLHHSSMVVEAHRDCYELIHWRNQGEANPLRDRTVPRLRRGEVDVTVYAVGGDSMAHSDSTERPLLATLANIDAVFECLADGGGGRVILSAGDVPEEPDGQVRFLLHLEGGRPLEGRLSSLRSLYRLGLRSMQLTWNNRNEIADGVMESRTQGGLTEFGVSVVREMQRLGMVVDLAHIAEPGFWQALEVTEGPVVVTHANSKVVFDHPRSLTDAQAAAIAERGGVVGVQATPRVVHPDAPNVDRLVDHIAHYCDVIGAEHVGLGLDFSVNDGPRPGRERLYPGKRGPLDGLAECDELPALTDAMLRRGFADSDVVAILGGNFCRVFRQVLRDDTGVDGQDGPAGGVYERRSPVAS